MVEEEAQDEGEPDEGVLQEEAPLYVEEVAADAEEGADVEESAEHEQQEQLPHEDEDEAPEEQDVEGGDS